MARPLAPAVSLPPSPLERIRLLFGGLALLALLQCAATAATAGGSRSARAAVVAVAVALGIHWVRGLRRGGFPVAAEPIEALAVLLLLRGTPGDPMVPLFGLVFRSMYGGLVRMTARYAMWVAALLLAHAHRGFAGLQPDLARAVALAIVPPVLHVLRRAVESSAASERRLRSLVQHSSDVTTVVGADGRVRWQADSIRALGLVPEDVVDRPVIDLVHPDDRDALTAWLAELRDRAVSERNLTLRGRHADGRWRVFEVIASNRLDDPALQGVVLNMRDATERHRLEQELRELAARQEHEATHDALTGLANRRHLYAALQAECAAPAEGALALLLIDLDHFKELNDTLGHAAGDEILRQIRPRLAAAVPGATLLSRLGGDEFAVLLRSPDALADATEAAERVRAALEPPFTFHGLTLLVRASVGIAAHPLHARDAETLVQRADVAMYSAKRRGIGHEVYSSERDVHSRDRLALLGELPLALETGQLVVRYQPKVDLRTERIVGAEALVRWLHPTRGLLGPGTFLPLVEQTGLMRPLTLQVLADAMEQCAAWRRDGLPLSVAVNLGAPNLLDLALAGDIARLLDVWGLEPAVLHLEITETIIGADPVRLREVMTQLRDLGATLSLDDFGTGSSSLGYLRELPVQELKIDRSFLADLAHDERSAAIVETIVALAKHLGLRSVAEGVETEAGCERLAAWGCDLGQGFLFGAPMTAAELTAAAQVSYRLGRRPRAALARAA